MADRGHRFKYAIVRYLQEWVGSDVNILTEIPVGYRFVDTPRYIDIVIQRGDRYVGIEAKLQESEGTTYEKLSYTIEDCLTSPIPTITAFAGNGIKMDMKSKLILSGIGLELIFHSDDVAEENDWVEDRVFLLRQRISIILGIDWFSFFKQVRDNHDLPTRIQTSPRRAPMNYPGYRLPQRNNEP